LDEAKVQYEKVLGLDNRAAAASNNLAQLYVDRKREPRRRAPTRADGEGGHAGFARGDDTLGWSLLQEGCRAPGDHILKQAVAAAPANAVYLYHLGAAYALNKDKVNARQTLEKALKLQPGFLARTMPVRFWIR
jgi:Flp pilus assembly protein TadD